jgi:hypothetical protein
MAAQTQQPNQWIVVDDGIVPTQTTMGQTVIRRQRLPDDPQYTLIPNLLAGLDAIDGGSVGIVEDDDYYSPGWIEWLVGELESSDIAGEGNAIYYHVGRRAWWNNRNARHASLCQTGFKASVVPILKRLCASPSPFVDVGLWNAAKHLPASLRCWSAPQRPFAVGIKGMPGRKGIGAGHIRDCSQYRDDPAMAWLSDLIGDDAKAYESFYDRN